MTATATNSRPAASDLGLLPNMLNHYARVTHDVGATADFYSRVLGMEVASTIMDDHVPSTGDLFPYFHIFFRMGDGSTMAFFECIDLPLPAAPSHPAYDVFEHIALEVKNIDELQRWREWLVKQGVDVLGPVDHKGIIQSIYFRDPNGYRLELTTPIDPMWNQHHQQAKADLDLWLSAKKKAHESGADLSATMLDLIRTVKQKRYNSKV